MRGCALAFARPIPGGGPDGTGMGLSLAQSSAFASALPFSGWVHDIALDGLFEYHISLFRHALGKALDAEALGPARHLRAYVRAVCASAIVMGPNERAAVASLMCNPEYRVIWSDFIDEVCSSDSMEPATQMTCRYTVEGLWLDHALERVSGPDHVADVLNSLLALTDA